MSTAVLINANARLGSNEVVRWVHEWLPRARLAFTHSALEAHRWLQREVKRAPPDLLIGAGGDGTMVQLLNELRELGLPSFPTLGALPLGTGNAWAHATGGYRAQDCLAKLSRVRDDRVPKRPFSVLEVEGQLCHFAGTGWDAEIIHDYEEGLKSHGPLPKALREGLSGYVGATLTRTVPRHLKQRGRTQVRLLNLGEPALAVSREGAPVSVPTASRVLYDGPMSVASVSTTPEWGMGFRAFPYAGLVPGRASARVYSGGVLDALPRALSLWRGKPVPKMHDFLLTRGRMEFDRPMPFQVGGDLEGLREAFEFRVAPEQVQLVDWSALRT